MTPFISLCMIVKNEEKVLKRCLESIHNHVDEIIIADTGSTDSTKEIAKLYTTNIYDFDWINDFSEARNFVQSKAKGQWIIYLDADEYVDNENLKQTIQHLRESEETINYDAYVVTQINFVGNVGGNVGQCPTIRIYKNDSNIYFHRKIHEQLFKKEGQLSIGFLGLKIYHSGYLSDTTEGKNKNDRNVKLIKKEINKNNKNGFDHFNLANEFLTQWKIEDALSSYRRSFQLKGSIDKLWVPMAVERIVFCLIELKRYSEALDVISGAIDQWPNVADFRSQRALIYFKQYRFFDVENELSPLINEKHKYTTVQSLSYLDYLPNYILGRINELNNNLSESVYYYAQALNFNDKDIETLQPFYKLLLKNESEEKFTDFIDNSTLMENEMNRIYFLKILLDAGEVNIIEYYLKRWGINPSTGFKFKMNISKNRYNFARSLLNKNSISNFIAEGWTDSYDILLLALQLNKKDIFYQLLDEDKELKCMQILFDEGFNVVKVEKLKNHLLILIDRCIILKKYEIIDKIIEIAYKYSLHIDIGNLFYKHGFKEIAVDLYGQLGDTQLFDNQSYVNIIDWFIQLDNVEEALLWAFTAIEQNNNDFRIYNAILQLLENRNVAIDIVEVVELALKHYPDSNYLQRLISSKQLMNK
ncbi:glycosyltransferase family 2 protein [Bacillus sp. FJAT-49711]|uniref:glycosyltransferase family 2 protein n=1 Tax=Bacillus sp. FJAT-49711 TaxID=2833585 RepID=UPI001BCA40FC|nr:glycosyltransferase family 2 protein [Bacillus sp. FJAT-49711]MBS4219336.1 glycosyltransferase family 2 protein [Bacillus sp. FJAT-49711]